MYMGFIAALLGLFIGSFLNVLIDRLPKGQNVLWGRSHCDYCKRTLRWYELIPVLSFIVQGGKCLRCKKPLSWQYPGIELTTAAGYGVIWYLFTPNTSGIIAACIIFSAFLVMFMADLKEQIIPDSMIVTGILGTALWGFENFSLSIGEIHLLSGFCTFAFFYVLWLITKRKGIGFGDVKISFLIGLLLGYPQTIMALYVAFLTGAFVGVILILGGKKKLKSKIAFGPFLIFGVVSVLLFNSTLLPLWNSIF